jgi:GAF domain-containing protein
VAAWAEEGATPRQHEDLLKIFANQAVIAIENARLLNELRESLDRQTAAADVLRIIASTPGELDAVFKAMLENARHICEAKFGILMLRDGEGFRSVAIDGAPDAYTQAMRENPHIPPRPGSGLVVLVETRKPVQLADVQAEPGYVGSRLPQLAGARTLLIVPMLKDDTVIGAINVYRQEVRSFTEQQIALLQNFAAQAVIAIENARLLNELRQRTADLSESLEQQTATSEVLKTISSSPGELEPVFHAMLANATRICEAKFGILYRCEGDALRTVVMHDAPQPFVEARQSNPIIRPNPHTTLGRAMTTKQPVQIANILEELDPLDDRAAQLPKLADARTVLAVPILKENDLVGAFLIYRTEVRPFTEKQIALVQSFAAQAVIAIENARLLSELRQRTADLSESLEQQTATSEILHVISSTPGELEPVFQTILEKAVHICNANFGTLFRFDGGNFYPAAQFNTPAALLEATERRGSFKPTPGSGVSLYHVMRTKQVFHRADMAAEPVLAFSTRFGGARSQITVPMLKDDALIGAIVIYRQEVRPFNDKQIALVENFAAQAVIAIENTRLLKELRERTDQLANLNQQLEARVADQVGEIERMSRLRRFLPPQVADLIVASGTEKQLESHRREITALFCDLRGFTGFSESSDPEDVMALLAEYHAAIGTIINKYSGTLERYAGDGVMVIFNDPVPVENPALQAVLMALDMRAAIGGLIEKWRDLGHDLGFGIGIAHGFATLGTIGFEGRRDYAAIGTVSNVASRLCDEAKPGQILVSPRVRQAVEKTVTVEPIGEFTLKGIRRPMMTHNVLKCAPCEPS